ncbi:MAG: DUF423 domain-containing protein [Flavobacterium sp.]|jgi:uncharacterized membrane protein YgdD (TMEM256/DUF423 family)|uniref:DUF423 domain-containing protein n=1 Tax=Flavobacterium TaxID=237 RepID=UPI0022C50BB6|nr:DUF423 domain-containing protein [Flavobacterium sp.]MCZ8089678.1 DUF423 domain-containing protein [Flavobacterium sp.]MCZ8332376.1 DUF423 domain-containing protein [Flavobacterium sp.]
MERKIIATAAFLGLTAIILGAFGAHALKNYLSPEQLISFETGVKYQIYHALFLLFLGLSGVLLMDKTKKRLYWLVVLGVILFSGSIYLLTTKNVTGIDFKFLGPITPIGGMLLITAWGILLVKVLNKKS